MASALHTEEDDDDFVTCPVCLTEYDDVVENRKPKFLPCSHSLCLECLQSIKNGSSLKCPICRKVCSHSGDVSSIPNNSYALHILRMRNKSQAQTGKSAVKIFYCLACNSTYAGPTTSCPRNTVWKHPTTDMSSHVVSHVRKTLGSLNQDLARLRYPLRAKVDKAILEKKDIQSYLEEVSRALKAADKELDLLKGENKTILAELTSLKDNGLLVDPEEGCWRDDLLADLIPLLENGRSDDTPDIIEAKMKRSFQDLAKDMNRKLDSCLADKTSQLVSRQAKRRLSVQSTDPAKGINEEVDLNVNWEAGVESGLMVNSKEQILISYLVQVFLARRGGTWNVPPIKPNSFQVFRWTTTQSRRISFIECTLEPASPSALVPKRPNFVLVVKRQGFEMGQIQIESSKGPNLAFLSDLAESLGESPPPLRNTVDKALPGSLVTLPILLTRDLESKVRFVDGVVPRSPGDVGIFNTKIEMDNRPLWSLFFTLYEFDGTNTTVQHRKTMESAALLGRVTSKGLDTLNEISKLTKFDRQFCKFTLKAI